MCPKLHPGIATMSVKKILTGPRLRTLDLHVDREKKIRLGNYLTVFLVIAQN